MSIFNNYFQQLEEVYSRIFHTLPTVAYTDDIKKELLVGEMDEDEEIQWRPIKQDCEINWLKIEKIFGFVINPELKEYYSTFYFLSITGNISKIYISLYSVGGTKSVEQDIRQHFSDGKNDFISSQMFLIGEATIGSDDSYFVYYDNQTKEVFCFDREKKKKYTIAESLAILFYEIKADY